MGIVGIFLSKGSHRDHGNRRQQKCGPERNQKDARGGIHFRVADASQEKTQGQEDQGVGQKEARQLERSALPPSEVKQADGESDVNQGQKGAMSMRQGPEQSPQTGSGVEVPADLEAVEGFQGDAKAQENQQAKPADLLMASGDAASSFLQNGVTH